MTLSKAIGVVDTTANRKQIAKYEDQGVEVLKFPQITPQRVADLDAVLRITRALSNFDWIIFTDIHAADTLLEVMQENGHDLFELDELVVCALGEAVVDRLRFVQVHSDVVPASNDEESVIQTIESFVADPEEFRSANVLFVKGESKEYPLVKILREKVKRLVELDTYRTDGMSGVDQTRLLTLINSGAIDEFRFCSPEDVESLLCIAYPKPLFSILEGLQITASDAVTFQTLREHGLKPRMANPT